MAVPKRKLSKARVRKRAAHHAIPEAHLAKCGRCGTTIMPHTVCGSCGHYRGNMIVNMEDDEA